jgi:hypothetical protein
MGSMDFFKNEPADVNLLTGSQRRVLKQSGNILEQQLGQAGPVYQGPMVPGATPGMQNAFNANQGALNRGANVNPAINQMLSGQTDPAAVNQYYQKAFVQPAQQGFRNTMDTVAQRYGDTYGQSGGMMRGMGQASNDFNTNLSGQLAGLQFGERESARQRQGQGVQLGIGEQANYMNTLSSMLGIGGQERAIQGQQNQAEFAKWNAGQAYNNPWLQSLMGPVLGTQSKGSQPQNSMASSVAELVHPL